MKRAFSLLTPRKVGLHGRTFASSPLRVPDSWGHTVNAKGNTKHTITSDNTNPVENFRDGSGHHPVGPTVVKSLYRRLIREARKLDRTLEKCANSPIALLELKHIIKTITPALPEEMETSLLVRGANVLYWSGQPLRGQVEVAVRNIFRRSVSDEYRSTLDWGNTDPAVHARNWFGRGTSALRSISAARVLLHSTQLQNRTRDWQDLILEYERSAFRVPIEMGALLMIQNSGNSRQGEDAVDAQLNKIAEEVRWRLESVPCDTGTSQHRGRVLSREGFERELQVLSAMNNVLFGDAGEGNYGLRGTLGSRLPPEHSLIDSVLSTRQGLPATLALIYIAVGQRLGVQVEPVALPSLVVVKPASWALHPLYQDKFINVVAKGEVVSRSWCEEVVSVCSTSATNRDHVFAPVHPLTLHARILSNLVLGSTGSKRPASAELTPSQAEALAWLDQLVVLMGEAPPVQNVKPEQMA